MPIDLKKLGDDEIDDQIEKLRAEKERRRLSRFKIEREFNGELRTIVSFEDDNTGEYLLYVEPGLHLDFEEIYQLHKWLDFSIKLHTSDKRVVDVVGSRVGNEASEQISPPASLVSDTDKHIVYIATHGLVACNNPGCAHYYLFEKEIPSARLVKLLTKYVGYSAGNTFRVTPNPSKSELEFLSEFNAACLKNPEGIIGINYIRVSGVPKF